MDYIFYDMIHGFVLYLQIQNLQVEHGDNRCNEDYRCERSFDQRS